jgi:hypothetical protein
MNDVAKLNTQLKSKCKESVSLRLLTDVYVKVGNHNIRSGTVFLKPC